MELNYGVCYLEDMIQNLLDNINISETQVITSRRFQTGDLENK